MFDPDEKRFLTAVAPRLAEGAKRALLVGEATDPEGPDAPGSSPHSPPASCRC
jgi:hypothetical protein